MNPYPSLTRAHGRKVVMSLSITDDELDRETARQIPILQAAIRPLLTGTERRAMDFGCGAGRFTPMLADMMPLAYVHGYDPCIELLRLASAKPYRILYSPIPTRLPCDMIFAAMVLGHPEMDTAAVAHDIAAMLSADGLMVVVDHMPDEPPPDRWWRFMPRAFYAAAFGAVGIQLREVGRLMQLDNEITIMAGWR